MNTPTSHLTVDDAMSEFQAALREARGDSPPDAAMSPATPEEREEGLFRFAELVLSLACPDPRACSHPHCRRDVRCRHFARIEAKRASGKATNARRTPGAEAARYAVWVYMSSAQ
jgi:hypothetical protein